MLQHYSQVLYKCSHSWFVDEVQRSEQTKLFIKCRWRKRWREKSFLVHSGSEKKSWSMGLAYTRRQLSYFIPVSFFSLKNPCCSDCDNTWLAFCYVLICFWLSNHYPSNCAVMSHYYAIFFFHCGSRVTNIFDCILFSWCLGRGKNKQLIYFILLITIRSSGWVILCRYSVPIS